MIPSKYPYQGFVHPSKESSGQRLETTTGQSVYFVGENLAWLNSTYQYEEYLDQLRSVHANWIRIWIGPFNLFTLEHKLGVYDQDAADRLDNVLDMCLTRGIFVTLTMESFNSFRTTSPYPMFDTCPFNVKNGGMLTKPEDFFTNTEAQSFFKRRIRYIMSRYSCWPNVVSFELFNEVDLTQNFKEAVVVEWHKQFLPFVDSLDIYARRASTSFFFPAGSDGVQSLPSDELLATHAYQPWMMPLDYAEGVQDLDNTKWKIYHKPHMVEVCDLFTLPVIAAWITRLLSLLADRRNLASIMTQKP